MNQARSANWEQVKELFEAVLARPFAERDVFLSRATDGDEELRREVESLIKSYEQAESFLEQPAAHSAAESLLENQTRLKSGQRVNHYEIVSAIGEGGMGEVYLARDTTLGRRVALKLLPEYFANDANRMRRFKQEARAASVLSHPNVCVIHEVSETEDGRPFITMEYVEGPTLRERMVQSELSMREALDVAIQIADALTAAHDAGIVHRDIKPENIVLRPDGYVKVLDFGLAKLTESREGFNSQTATTLLRTSTPGLVMGTVAYMSPEQARGVAVDHRTDIWSLGVVLYEMISSRVPFEGETPTDVVVGIVERDQPPLAESIEGLPAELDRIVRKALKKDRDERYQLAKEMGIDLRSLRRELQSELELGRSVAPSRPRSKSQLNRPTTDFDAARRTTTLPLNIATANFQRIGLIILAVFTLAAALLVSYRLLRNRSASAPHRFQRVNVTKLTTNGNAAFAAISRDGKYVAYVLNEAGRQSLWLRQVAVESNVRLLAARDGHYLGIAFSPDGNYIYYGFMEGNGGPQLYKVPVLAMGAPAMRISLYTGPQSASHDGKRIAFFQYDDAKQEDRLIVANVDGSNEQVVATKKWPERFGWNWDVRPAWSSDDERLSAVLIDNQVFVNLKIYEIGLADRIESVFALTGKKFESSTLQGVSLLPDASGVIATGKAQGASFSQVWQLSRDGPAQQITNDLSDYLGMSINADSSAIVTVQRQVFLNLWVAPQLDPVHSKPVTSGAGRYFDTCWTPDGKVLYASDASGSAHIYEMDLQSMTTRALTDVGRNYAPAVSPDGSFIAFHSNRSGAFQIWRADRDGSNPKQLTDAGEANWPQFSADGKWIVYQRMDVAAGSLWKVPVEGGTPVAISDVLAMRPVISPDGNLIACWARDQKRDAPWRLGIIPISGAGRLKFFDVAPTVAIQWDVLIRWTPDSRSVTFVDHRGGFDNVWAQPIDGSPAKPVTEFKDSLIFSFDWSRDGKLLISRGFDTNDVVLISEAK